LVLLGGQVRAEVVADDRDPDLGWVEGAQVAAEFQEPGPGLARLDMPIQLVFTQLVSGEQVPHPAGAGVGGAAAGPWLAAWFFVLAADRGPLPPRMGLEVQRPELIDTEDHLRLPRLGDDLAVSDRVQVFHPGL